MLDLLDRRVAGRHLRVAMTERDDGDLHPVRVDAVDLTRRQVALNGQRWEMAHQRHGAEICRVDVTGPLDGDVLVADAPSAPIAVWTADCASVILATESCRLVGVHAGWRGLAEGVLQVAVDEATTDGDRVAAAVLGAAIGPCCYEFGATELAAVADGVGAEVDDIAGVTSEGAPALDVAAAVTSGLAHRGVMVDAAVAGCTGCYGRWWSHRVGRDLERQALVGWWT